MKGETMDRNIVASFPLVLTSETAPDETTVRAIESGLDAYNNSIAPYDGSRAVMPRLLSRYVQLPGSRILRETRLPRIRPA